MNHNFLLGQSTGIVRKLFPSVPRSWLVLVIFAGLGSLAKVQADGTFVAPKFVWDKHKDINEPMQKAIMVYDAGREDLILQVKYKGPVDEFGWLIPVPNLPTVEKVSMKCFYELSQFTQQHFEEGQFMAGAASLGTKSYRRQTRTSGQSHRNKNGRRIQNRRPLDERCRCFGKLAGNQPFLFSYE